MAARKRGRRPADPYQVAAKKLKLMKKHLDAIVRLSEGMVANVEDTVIRSVLDKIAFFEKSVPDLIERSRPILDRGARLLSRISEEARSIERRASAGRRKPRGRKRGPSRTLKAKEAAAEKVEQPAAE